MEHAVTDIEGIGPITLRRSRKAKRISIRIRPGRPAEVVLPGWASFRNGTDFAREKKKWIRKHYARFSNRKEKLLTPGTIIHTQQSAIRLEFIQNNVDAPVATCDDGSVTIVYSRHSHFSDSAVQDSAKRAIYRVMKKEARAYLPHRLAQLADRYGYQYNRVTIRNQKTLWGSCSGKKNINLNLHLVTLPGHLIDYVLVHELVHTRHRNHGPSFWAAVDHCLGHGKAYARELRRYEIDLQNHSSPPSSVKC